MFESSYINSGQTGNRTFKAATTGTYYVSVIGPAGHFNIQVSGLTPVITDSVDVLQAEGGGINDVIFKVRLSSPLKEGQFVALSFNEQTGELVRMNCIGLICTLDRRLNLPSSSLFRAGVFGADNQLIGSLTSQSACLLSQCVFALSVSENGLVRIVDNKVAVLGVPLRLEVLPNEGFKASRAVAGTCTRGNWISATIYEISDFNQACTAIFNFTELKRKNVSRCGY
ncbi:hypothetical protein [Alishewanella longhuensis]